MTESFADLPPWVLEKLTPLPATKASQNGHSAATPPTDAADTGAHWMDKALEKVAAGAYRNDTGHWLACQLRDAGMPENDAELWMELYAMRAPVGDHPYTERDALATLRSAFGRPAREPARALATTTSQSIGTSSVRSERSVKSLAPSENQGAGLSTLSTLLTPVPTYPVKLAPEAYYGLMGDLVSTLAPETEADPVAILAQLLAAFGNAAGRHAYFRVGADLHYPNLFLTLVGPTSGGRKGLSFGLARQRIAETDVEWADDHILGGLASGEGLIHHVRDANPPHDPGVEDKRLLVHEPEFASVLKVATREGNTLSAIVRQAWDGHSLHNLTKTAGAKATAPHISIIGHITKEELNRYLTTTEAGNGFGNRFLWLCVRRSHFLPDGGDFSSIAEALKAFDVKLRAALGFASSKRELKRDDEAKALWHQEYRGLAEGHPGLLGALTNRAEAQVMRLALLYALLDKSEKICLPHLQAGLALWRYADASAAYVFGTALGDPVADAVVQKVRASGAEGVPQTSLTLDYGRHGTSALNRALGWLQELRLIESIQRQTGGRPETIWRPVQDA